jgi:dipeptidyl aminopeptidase/acylaminoacyl peptidase
VQTGTRILVAASTREIESFSSSSNGNAVVYSERVPSADAKAMSQKKLNGFVVRFGVPVSSTGNDIGPDSIIHVVRNALSASKRTHLLCNHGISTKSDGCAIPGVSALSLSPDGNYLTFNFRPAEVPPAWKSNTVYKWLADGGVPVDALELYSLQTNQARLAFNATDAGFERPTMWSNDSRSFSVVSLAPVGSSWERDDIAAGFLEGRQLESFTHVFAVDVLDGSVSQVLKTPPVWSQSGILFWKNANSPMLVQTDAKTFTWLVRDNNLWREKSHFGPAVEGLSLEPSAAENGAAVASNGEYIIGIAETTMSPPDIFVDRIKTNRSEVLTDLNPEYREIALGNVEKISWKNSVGADCTGYLIKPVAYRTEHKYPLVIMAKGWTDSFISDTRFQTAFPPQSLANAGFVVLMANMPGQNQQPKSYTANMGETFNWIAMVESGITHLDELGLIDWNNVGIMGFSRTSWDVDFMITHSSFRFAAASSADSGLYNYGSYWYNNSKDTMRNAEQQFGGPPYGASWKEWLSYSPAFNAQAAHVPLLMEYCGYGFLSEPLHGLEFFVALNRQEKPVELYFYPQGDHVLDTPAERVASLQRNVDWFRFWMQGIERPGPEDSEQYVRWHALRNLYKKDQAGFSGGLDSGG